MKLFLLTLTISLVSCSLALAQILASTDISQSLRNKVIFSPDVPFLWNFQRGAEELYRFAKFTSVMRVGYSLDLADRRVGEIEVLTDKNESSIVPTVEDAYEMEIDKVQSEMNTPDIFSLVTNRSDIVENVTQRLNYDINVLDNITSPKTKDYISKAVKKTSGCVGFINGIGG